MNADPPSDQPLQITTRDQAESAGAIVLAIHQQIKAAEIKSTRVAFAAQKLTSRIGDLKSRLVRYESALKDWAQHNRSEMGESKTLSMRHVTISFHNSRPSVKFLEGWTLASVLAKLRTLPRLKKSYIRTKEELDRQRILSDARPEVGKLDVKTMRSFGVEVASDEFFYIDPKFEPAKS